jgi:hypothetical protein
MWDEMQYIHVTLPTHVHVAVTHLAVIHVRVVHDSVWQLWMEF